MGSKESETIELKRSTSETKEGVISICAILNKHQEGELYFGIRNDGTVVGQAVNEKTIRDVSKAISENIETRIYPIITKIETNGKICIKVEFKGTDSPYFAYGRAYIRVGDEDRQLSAKEIENIILKKNKDRLQWDNQICGKASLNDIDSVSLQRYIELAKKSKRMPVADESEEMVLKKLNLITDDGITNACVLLFGKEPFRYFYNNVVKCGRFRGIEKQEFIDMKDFSGNLFENLEKSLVFLQEHLRLRARIKGLLREETWEIPIEALREAIINALIHRDYQENSFVYIKVYDSRIVIANPGGLPDTLTIEDLYKEHESMLRNPLIAKVFYYAGLIDVWGRGIINIINMLKANELELPSFEESGGSFRIIFTRPKSETVIKGSEIGSEKSSEKILGIIKENRSASAREISSIIGISQRAVEKHISALKKQGIIKRIGPARGGYWETGDSEEAPKVI